MLNHYNAILYRRRDDGGYGILKEEFHDKTEAIEYAIAAKLEGTYHYGMVCSEKQRDNTMLFNELYDITVENNSITLFVEPTREEQLEHCCLSLSWRKHNSR